MKKACSLVLIIAMLVSMLGIVPAVAAAQVPKVTWMLPEQGTTADPGNPVLKALEAAVGIEINPIQVPPGDENAKLNAMIAAKQLPDLFTCELKDAAAFIEEGMIIPLDELLDKCGGDIRKEMDGVLGNVPANQIDGQIYMIPRGSTKYTNNLNIRVDWLKKLGLEMPTDLDSLYNVLHAFTYDDPDGNGQKDTVGMVLTMAQENQWDNLFGAFGIAYMKNYLLEDGTVTTWMKSPRFLDAISYLRKLYQEGVIDPEFSTMPAMTAHERW